MEIRVIAVGRAKNNAFSNLIDDYVTRAQNQGRQIGFSPIVIHEIDERKARDTATQSEAILRVLGDEFYWAMDERGRQADSIAFSKQLTDLRDQGLGRLNIIIGGADGLSADLRNGANSTLSFGKMVWPHLLARVMLTEQIYRAMAITTGTPYHRE